jgi:hypothetical protein
MNIKKSYVIIAAILILVLVGVSLLLNRSGTGVLEITAPESTPSNAAVAVRILRDGKEEKTLVLKPGQTQEIRIKKGIVRVDGQADTLKSVDIVEVKGFSTTKLTTPTGEQRAITQLASDSQDCPAIVGDNVFSYGCEGEGTIVRHDSQALGNSLNTTLFDGLSFSNLKPVKDGLVGFYATAGSPTVLVHVNLATQTLRDIQLPEAVAAFLEDQPEIAVSTGAESSRFALLFTQKDKIFVFDDADDTTPTEIKPGKDVSINQGGRRVSASFDGDTFILYAGVSTDGGEGEVAPPAKEDEDPKLEAYLFEYDKTGKLTKSLTLPNDLEAQGVYRLGSGFYAADQPYGFGFFRSEDDELQHVYTITEMGSWTIANNRAYVEAEGTLYEFKPGKNGLFSMRSLYSSPTLTVSSLYNAPSGVIFTGLPDDSKDAPLNIYQLTDKKEKSSSTNNQNNTDQTDTSRTEPAYTGFNELLYYGVSSFQVANMRFALSNYAATAPAPISAIRITDVVPQQHDRFSESTITVVNFLAILNDREIFLNGKLEIHDLSTIRVYLFAEDGTQVYDSQIISNKEPASYNPEPQH